MSNVIPSSSSSDKTVIPSSSGSSSSDKTVIPSSSGSDKTVIPSSSGSDKILTCNNIVLRRSHVETLRGPFFISDGIIDFYFNHLSSSLRLSSHGVLLVPPTISFFIANCLDSQTLNEIVGPLQLHDKEMVIFTINDNMDVEEGDGGLHWSLLVYDKDMNAFIHHDSQSGLNNLHAIKLYEVVKGFVGPEAMLFEGDTPPQKNLYDCGLYVMAIARVICEWHVDISKNKLGRWFPALEEEVNANSLANLRHEVLSLILDLARQNGSQFEF